MSTTLGIGTTQGSTYTRRLIAELFFPCGVGLNSKSCANVIFFFRITGGELFDLIVETGFFSEDDGRKVVHSILTAILYCHERHVVHRDIKACDFLFLPATLK